MLERGETRDGQIGSSNEPEPDAPTGNACRVRRKKGAK